MDNIRLLLWVSLGFLLFYLWQTWQKDYPIDTVAGSPSAVSKPATLPREASVGTNGEIEDDGPELQAQDEPFDQDEKTFAERANRIKVSTDVYDIDIDTAGGDIRRVALLKYPIETDKPDRPIVLMDDTESLFFISQNGLRGETDAPTHHAKYSTDKEHYILEDGEDSLTVTLTWDEAEQSVVKKTYTFHRDSYVIDVNYEIENSGDDPWKGRIYKQLQRRHSGSSKRSTMVYSFTGAALSSPDKRYDKMDFDDLSDQPINQDIVNGWVAMLEHYFVAAVIPEPLSTYHYYSKELSDRRYIVGFYGPETEIGPGKTGNLEARLYVGPKLQKVMENVAPNLELTNDYGIFWFIAKPLFWLLDKIHTYTNNWGVAIILVTLIIKLSFFKLSAAGYKSMANMRRVTPQLKALKEKHGDDKAGLNQAMMALYKKEKINPLGGCFPILVQIPVFIALYWMLAESVELRHADFFLWINDLSAPDPFFVLPLLFGISMFIQQKLNPTPTDPMQEKVMQFLPIIFTFFFALFPSGLVLYWVVNNTLSIVQQWVITKHVLAEKPARA